MSGSSSRAGADEDLRVGDRRLERGARQTIRLPVTTGLNGGEVSVVVHAVSGRRPGPVLALLGGMHGDEWFMIEAIRRLLDELDAESLRGTVLAVPFVNGPALARVSRNMPDNTDSPDLNRLFPGPLTATSDQIVAVLSGAVLARATHILDFHIGPWGSAFRDMLIAADAPDPEVVAESERLALAFGAPIVRAANVLSGFPGPRSTLGYGAGVLGVPTIGVEVGGSGFGSEIEGGWRREVARGVGAIMAAIGMIADGGADPRPDRQLVYRDSYRLNPSVGGLLLPRIGPDRLSTELRSGELLGEVISPYTLETLEELRVKADGILTYVARDYPVNPGDWGFGVAIADGPGARWVRNGP